MKYRFLILSFIYSLLFPSTFEFSDLDISVYHNDTLISNPFSGGLNHPIIQWYDLDSDDDSDLFILDKDGFIRYYENISSDSQFKFQIKTAKFMDIFAGQWFVMEDYDLDGDMDIFSQNVENDEHISIYNCNSGLYQFVGRLMLENNEYVTTNPVMVPDFVDIDNDGDLDYFSGNVVGTINFYENISSTLEDPIFIFRSNMWENILIIGPTGRHGASAITFNDIDSDSDFDLSWGDYYQQSLYIIQNIGDQDEPMMDINNIISEYPLSNPIVSAGQNMPNFCDIDNDGDQDLFISVLSGAFGSQTVNNFYYYKNSGIVGINPYEYQTNNFLDAIDVLTYASPELYDIDLDGDLDLFIGNKSDPSQPSWSGSIHYYENIGTIDSPIFNLESTNFFETSIGYNLSVTFGDLNSDSLPDAIVGDYNGYLHVLYQTENLSFQYNGILSDIDLSGHADPQLIDFDGDNDLDIVVGDMFGNIFLVENTGNSMFQLIDISSLIDHESMYSTIEFIDVDRNGELDIILGSWMNSGKIYLNFNNEYYLTENYSIPFLGYNTSFASGDLNNDGSIELIAGISTGGVYILSQNCNAGDVNMDEIIDILDIMLVVNIILNQNFSDYNQMCTSDLNNDDEIDILDIMILINMILN